MSTDWHPSAADVAATRQARKAGDFKAALRQQIADGRSRLQPGGTNWPTDGQRKDLYGITCPRCTAGPDQKCHLRTRDKTLPKPHQQRVAAWAELIASCPECQVTPGAPCRDGKWPLAAGSVHARRYQEAEGTAA
ncbi:hypothetical protein GCM10009837_06870 [Streptomyces durmitorensis]|uniref:DNA-binding phage zinc finger domain-containing protein n=1 Tax=Streptomyces durmitorensis TaxID=319947 RepID=A0ABY4PMS8_9ACTN|nr:hypothetical protein [Streptomyces durmitorensis]UQT54417.1 hypothetical protein M4V62_04545 [Streptomyces durmitorensis]